MVVSGEVRQVVEAQMVAGEKRIKMKHVLMTMLFGVLFLMVGTAFAFNVPTPNGYVTDTSGKLTSAQVQQLNAKLTEYNHRTKNEVAVVMVPSLEGAVLSDATNEVFQAFKIGKAGLDNGVLLFIAVNDHKMRLETGKGIEGEITDVESHTILTSMGPSFRANDFNGGINSAIDQIETKLDSRIGQKVDPGQGQQFHQPVQTESTSAHSGGCSVGLGNDVGFGLGLIALFVVAVALVRRWVRKNEFRKMAALEAKVEAEMSEEAEYKKKAWDRKLRIDKIGEAVKADLEKSKLERDQRQAEVQAAIKAAEAKAVVHENAVYLRPAPRTDAIATAKPVQHESYARKVLVVDSTAETERAQARRRQEAEERAEEARAAERRERAAEERRAERRRQREEEESAIETAAAIVSIGSIFDNDSSSGSSSGSSYDTPSYDTPSYDPPDSGFGGGSSGGGGSDSDW